MYGLSLVIFPSNKEEDGSSRMQGMKNRDGEINGYTFTGETQNQTHRSICGYFQAGIFLAAAFIDAVIQRERKISCIFNYACITF